MVQGLRDPRPQSKVLGEAPRGRGSHERQRQGLLHEHGRRGSEHESGHRRLDDPWRRKAAGKFFVPRRRERQRCQPSDGGRQLAREHLEERNDGSEAGRIRNDRTESLDQLRPCRDDRQPEKQRRVARPLRESGGGVLDSPNRGCSQSNRETRAPSDEAGAARRQREHDDRKPHRTLEKPPEIAELHGPQRQPRQRVVAVPVSGEAVRQEERRRIHTLHHQRSEQDTGIVVFRRDVSPRRERAFERRGMAIAEHLENETVVVLKDAALDVEPAVGNRSQLPPFIGLPDPGGHQLRVTRSERRQREEEEIGKSDDEDSPGDRPAQTRVTLSCRVGGSVFQVKAHVPVDLERRS
jgi:hypothetical protein